MQLVAHTLNAERVQAPRPRGRKAKEGSAPTWSPNSIREMLRNEIYVGQRIWNRSRWIKRRDGRCRRIERREDEWVRHTDEALWISDDAPWARVQAQIQKRTTAMLGTVVQDEDGRDRPVRVPRSIRGSGPRHLLAGFLECAECGGSFHAMRHGRFGCSGNRDRGEEAAYESPPTRSTDS